MSPLREKSMGIVISWASKPHHSEFLQAALFSPCSILSPKTVFIRVLFVIIFSFSWFSCCYGKISDLKQLAYSSSWPLSMAGWVGGGGGGGRNTVASSGWNREKMMMNVGAQLSFSISFITQT